jgi:hypothetical protein
MAQPDFNQVCDQFRQFRAIVGQALAAPGDAAVKQQLQGLTATLDKTFVELQEAYPQAMAAIDAKLADVQKSAQDTSATLSGLKQTMAAAEEQAAAAAQSVPEKPAVDPALGQKLRDELLQRFGQHEADASTTGTGSGEIWQDWNWQDWSNN